MTAPQSPDARPPRRRRMNRSRAIAAGTSVGALVALTAGVAADNSNGDDTGWLGSDDGPQASDPNTDPNSGWSNSQPDTGSGTFDPGIGSGGGNTRSGGS